MCDQHTKNHQDILTLSLIKIYDFRFRPLAQGSIPILQKRVCRCVSAACPEGIRNRVKRKRKAHAKSERAACPLGTQQSQGLGLLHYASTRRTRVRNLTLPYRASLSLARRGKDFSADSSEREVLNEMCVNRS